MIAGSKFRNASTGVCLLALTTVARALTPCVEALDPADPGVVIIRCDGAVIAAEATAVRSSAALIAAHPRVIQLDAGALVVSLEPSAQPFKALTPEAVASAREGEWAVVTEAGRTRAMAWRGVVTLRGRLDAAETIVGPSAAEPPRLARLRRAARTAATWPASP